MGMKDNWLLFIKTTRNKSKKHAQAAQYWNTLGTAISLTLIFLGALTTFMALVKIIPDKVVAGFTALSTMLSATSAFLRPADRRQLQTAASREYQELMMRMVRCEEEREYEELWKLYNRATVEAPFVSKKFTQYDVDLDWTMTPELFLIIREKEKHIDAADMRPPIEEEREKPLGINNSVYDSLKSFGPLSLEAVKKLNPLSIGKDIDVESMKNAVSTSSI